MEKNIPLSIPNFEGKEIEYVNDALRQGWVSTGGAYINKLEENLGEFLKVNGVVACQSGTSAIHLSLIEAGVQLGNVVIVPSLTFIAAVNPVKYLYANPVFMDCDDSLCIDPQKLRLFLEKECDFIDGTLYYNGSVVKAIIVVHIFGNIADMEQIMDVSKRYNLIVIEDATEALGSCFSKGIYKGRYAGTIGDYGTFSFNGNKIITTGGGGAVVAKNEKSINHIKYLSTQAKDDECFYVHNEIGYNYRMTNLQAALGVAQLEMLPEYIRRKIDNYNYYLELFKNYGYAYILPFRKETISNKWFYSLVVDIEKIDISINDLVFELNGIGIQTRTIWGLIDKQKPYLNDVSYNIERANYYAERIINLPCSTQITREDIEYVVDGIKKTIDRHIG